MEKQSEKLPHRGGSTTRLGGLKIGLLGYGKMGKTIEQIAMQRGHEIIAKIDINNRQDLDKITNETVDVIIEFSSPESAYENLKFCMSRAIPTVCGTTGWLGYRHEIEKMCLDNNGAFFYSSNYSIGVNLFFRLNKMLAKLMNSQKQYSLTTTEIHHTEKKDAPSGTAITIAVGIIENRDDKTKWVNNELAAADEVPIWSAREGKVAGTHIVKYISDVDQIEIMHQAHSRQGFAEGAVIAAEFLKGKKGIFGMEDLLSQ
jgi:4-hydroxy-tetrahydrodipicolinate reductase